MNIPTIIQFILRGILGSCELGGQSQLFCLIKKGDARVGSVVKSSMVWMNIKNASIPSFAKGTLV